MYQLTIADVLNEANEPIMPGDYVEHKSKPGVCLLVVKSAYKLSSGNFCIDVQESHKRSSVRVRLDNVRRV